MITRVVLENFMAHEHTELELGAGINALTGPNNTGKSAIVEALRCVATNPMPKYYIRHGAKEARVTVEVEDGTRVVWVRKKRSSGYELWAPNAEEPEEYWKFGRKPPEDILSVLRLDVVDLEGNKDPIDVHIGNQRDPVFLLNQPKSDAAAFFAASTESAHLLAMQSLLKRKTQDSKRQEKELSGRILTVENELDRFSPLPDLELAAENARELEETANNFKQAIPVLENVIEQHGILSRLAEQASKKKQVLGNTQEVPTISNTSNLSEKVQQIASISSALKVAQGYQAELIPLTSPPATVNTESIATFCEELQALESALQQTEQVVEIFRGLVPPSEYVNTAHLAGIIDELLEGRSRLSRESRRFVVLQEGSTPPELEKHDQLQCLTNDIGQLEGQVKNTKNELHELENRLSRLETEIADRLGKVGRCPTCGGELSVVEFLDRGCRHGA